MSREPSDDFYALLGIDAHVNNEQLRQVWRKLARRWHPDHAGPAATAMFQKISAAYEVLSDPLSRAAYDRRRRAATPAAATRAGGRSVAPTTPRRRAPSVMLSRICGPLSSLLACGIARQAEAGLIDLFLHAQEAAQGGMITISMRVPVRRAHGIVDELFSAWLAVSPDIADGAVISPSASLPGMIQPVRFRIRIQPGKPA
jgi:curved DNA-binding protein CbpA